ncbi:Con-6 family protein [Sporobolomyces salmoneus]|uniref:Con-6 family protein n=1 Tax=Sporobolomyces salmoneus TaxID=183962 RepID=UPI003171AD49
MAHELRVEGDKVIESDSKGHVVSTKDYSHVHAGYVATTHNPRVSEGAKQNAEQLLHDLEAAHGDAPSTSHSHAAQGGEEHVPTTAENPHDTRSHDHPKEFHQHDQDIEQEKTHSEEVFILASSIAHQYDATSVSDAEMVL